VFIKSEKGSALPLTMVVVFVLTLLGFTLLAFSMTETRQVFRDENRMKAHYLARSGAHAVAEYIINNPENAVDLINSSESELVNYGDGTIKVLVYGNPFDEIYVRSTGEFNDVNQSVVVTVKNVGIDFPVYGNSVAFTAQGNSAAALYGGDAVYGNENGKNFVDLIVKEGEAVHQYFEYEQVVLPCEDQKLQIFYGACPVTPNTNISSGQEINETGLHGTIQLNRGNFHIGAYNPMGNHILLKATSIDLGGNAKMTVSLDNNIVALVVDKLEFTGNSSIVVEGDGHLLIYIKQLFEGRSDFVIDNDTNTYVNVYVLENAEFKLAGTPNFTGAVYAPDATVSLSGNSSVFGWIIANIIVGNGGVDINYVPIDLVKTSMDTNFFRLEKWRYDN